MWLQSCSASHQPSQATSVVSSGGVAAPCTRYAQLVGEARWRATREALLHLLQQRGACSISVTPQAGEAASRVELLSTTSALGARSSNLNLISGQDYYPLAKMVRQVRQHLLTLNLTLHA